MEAKSRLETLEDEIKLLKGELRQTLIDVRDHVLQLGGSPPTEVVYVEEGGAGGAGREGKGEGGDGSKGSESVMKGDIKGELNTNSGINAPQSPLPHTGEPSAEDSSFKQDEPSEKDTPVQRDRPSAPESETFTSTSRPAQSKHIDLCDIAAEQPELHTEKENNSGKGSQPTPQVNLLTNLLHWVTRAKQEIGSEQLSLLLDIYSISVQLPPELKKTILHLVEVTPESSVDTNMTQIWIQSIQTLHGILTGGDAPINLGKPSWDNETEETVPNKADADGEQPEEKPLELRLVLPGGNGVKKEYGINLYPEKNSS